MLAGLRTDVKNGTPQSRIAANDSADIRPGLVVSFLLHLLVALVLIWQMRAMQMPQVLQVALRSIPVDLVLLSEETASPPQNQVAKVPQQMKSALPRQFALQTPAPEAASPTPPDGVAPLKKQPPPDELDARLKALSELRQPDTDARLLDSPGLSNLSATSNGAKLGAQATYSMKDYVRAQVERRWSLNLGRLGDRNLLIPIRIQMKRDGTITKAEIVDADRTKSDKLYNFIAVSARNAVLLSSPVALPAGRYSDTMDMVLELNPRDVLR